MFSENTVIGNIYICFPKICIFNKTVLLTK